MFRVLRFALIGLAAGCGPATPARIDRTAPDAPTQQEYQLVGGRVISVSWRNPRAPDFETTLLARIVTGSDSPHSSSPSSQSDLKPGDPFGGSIAHGPGVVLYVGDGTTYLDLEAPEACLAFVYQLYSKDRAGNWSVGPAQLDVDPAATSSAPLAGPTAVSAAAVDSELQLAWTNPPAGTGVVELRVVRKAGSAPASPLDGVAVFAGAGSAAAEPLAGIGFGKWTYAVFACNGCGVCNSAPATVVFERARPLDPDAGRDAGSDGGTDAGTSAGTDGGALTPSGLTLQLSGDGKNVLMSWSNPAEVTSVKVLRTLNAQATGPSDPSATVVFEGMSSSTSERVDKLLPNTQASPAVWHYQVHGCRSGWCDPAGVSRPLTLTLGQALKGGGYTLFWRHATATVCIDQTQLGLARSTTQPNWWKSCDKSCLSGYARQLDTVQAPNEVAAIHSAFAARGFSVSRVLSSEFCRAVETAQGFNFGPPIELNQVLTYYVYDEAQRCLQTMELLNLPPSPGTNTALVSHAGFTCPIIDSLAWSEAAVFRPIGTSAPRYLGRVAWNGWMMLP